MIILRWHELNHNSEMLLNWIKVSIYFHSNLSLFRMYYYIDECLNNHRRAESWQSNSNHYSQPVLINEHMLFLQGTENPDRCFPAGYSMDLWLVARAVKHLSAMQETRGSIPGLGRYPGEGNGSPLQYSYLEKIPWMAEPGRLLCMGSQRVRHDWVTSLSLSRDYTEILILETKLYQILIFSLCKIIVFIFFSEWSHSMPNELHYHI